MSDIVGIDGKPFNGAPVLPRERMRAGAHSLLEHLKTLMPSEAAPLTEEDLAIFHRFARQHEFVHFARASYLDYFGFFIAETQRAHDEAMHVLATT